MQPSSHSPLPSSTSTSRIDYLYSPLVRRPDTTNMADGIWFCCNSLTLKLVKLEKPVTFISFVNSTEALAVARLLLDENHPNIPRMVAPIKDNDRSCELVVDRIPPTKFEDWIDLALEVEGMWTMSQDGKQYLELESRFQSAFKSISNGLAHLHGRGKYHGNLMEGIWLTEPDQMNSNFQLKLANFSTRLDFVEGVEKDLKDLKRLVELAVEKNDLLYPVESKGMLPALTSFYRLHKECLGYSSDFNQMREFAKFVYWPPLFWNWRNRYEYIWWLEEFSKGRMKQLLTYMIEDEESKLGQKKVIAPPEIKNWIKKVKSLDDGHPLKKLLGNRENNKQYKHSGGIFWFHRNALYHYGEDDMNKTGTMQVDETTDQPLIVIRDPRVAMDDLLETFPSAIPFIYERMIGARHRLGGGQALVNYSEGMQQWSL